MKLPKPLSWALRLAITVGAIWLAFSKVPLRDIIPTLKTLPWTTVVVALLLTHMGQVISAMRTRYYLQCQGIEMPPTDSLQLHYIGGMFNTLLPGGAGGDAYKAWWLKRHRQGGMFNMVKLMIANRLNGMWALGILVCAMAYMSAPIRALTPDSGWIIAGIAVAGTAGYSVIARFALREPLKQQMQAALYSLAIQATLAVIAYLLSLGLGLQAHALEYSIAFMLSCILVMIVDSIGGIGVRELGLLQVSSMLGLSQQDGVTLAFTFSLMALTIPLTGAVVYHFFAPPTEQVA